MAYWRKTKEERRAWWDSLSTEQQAAQVEKWQEKKAGKRRAKSIELMAKQPKQFCCSDCFHQKTESCTDDLPRGCEYWWNPNSQKNGPAYEKQDNWKRKRKKAKAERQSEKADKLWGEHLVKEKKKCSKSKVTVLPDGGHKSLQRYNVGRYG